MSEQPRLTIFGKLFVTLFVLACVAGGGWWLWKGRAPNRPPSSPQPNAPDGGSPPTRPQAAGQRTTLGVAYGTEKRRWMTWAVEQFEASPAGRSIDVELIPMGSIEGAHAVLRGDERIHVWSPASGLYRHNLVNEWEIAHSGSNPIASAEPLALSPMVFVFWDERYQAFTTKFQSVNFRTVGEALAEKGGWGAIAGKPEWGFFKFGHTHPNQSNSGLMSLVLLAYDFHGKDRGLTLGDVTNAKFQEWAQGLERAVSGLSNSTGNMMQEMVQRGPSTYDALFVYENTAIDYLKNAEGRWGRLRIAYPERNAWNDNPYYILNVPWSETAHRRAAEAFRDFLLSEPAQTQALTHGFRPANVSVPVKFPESPFTIYESYGLKIDVPQVCETPSSDVIRELLIGWQRAHPGG